MSGKNNNNNLDNRRRNNPGKDWPDDRSEISNITGMTQAFNALSDIGNNSTKNDVDNSNYNDQMDDYDETEDLPEFACAYCGICDPSCVVKCVDSNKWFCNGRGSTSASHIVQHLTRSKFRQVCLHPESPLGETTLECYNCGTRNVFLLGYIPAKSDSVVVLLCREPCLAMGALKELDWDVTQWQPLIEDRAFVPWLVRIPTEQEEMRAKQISNNQISKLEDAWRTNPRATLFEVEMPGVEEEIIPMLLSYEDGYNYQNIIAPLINLEAEADRQAKESRRFENISVRWDVGIGKKKIAVFKCTAGEDTGGAVVVGDELKLKLDDTSKRLNNNIAYEGSGHVLAVHDGEVSLVMKSHVDVPSTITDGYIVEFVWKPTTYDRMQNALKTFAVDDMSLSGYLYHRILGHNIDPQVLKIAVPSNLSVPGLPELNHSQKSAVKAVLAAPLSLIQGPVSCVFRHVSPVYIFNMCFIALFYFCRIAWNWKDCDVSDNCISFGKAN
jgi:regulator of nonsense transcripts 1